jgi:inner membrane protein
MFASNNVSHSGDTPGSVTTDSINAMWSIFGAIVSLAIIFLVDYYFKIASPRLITIAILDELAHISTAFLFLIVFKRFVNLPFAAGCLAGAVLIDLDRLPELFSTGTLVAQPERPITHSLVSVLGLLLIAVVLSAQFRWVFIGAALGVAMHLLRDLATGGVLLLWPVHSANIELSYAAYAVMIVALALVPMVRCTKSRFGPVTNRAWRLARPAGKTTN